jgi:hypothetical protein
MESVPKESAVRFCERMAALLELERQEESAAVLAELGSKNGKLLELKGLSLKNPDLRKVSKTRYPKTGKTKAMKVVWKLNEKAC